LIATRTARDHFVAREAAVTVGRDSAVAMSGHGNRPPAHTS